MRAHGVYYGLIEQQNSRHAEDIEEKEFETHDAIKRVVPPIRQVPDRKSTIASIASSILNTIYGNRNSINAENGEKQVEEAKVIKNKMYRYEPYSNRK
jgi:hypothetical protein